MRRGAFHLGSVWLYNARNLPSHLPVTNPNPICSNPSLLSPLSDLISSSSNLRRLFSAERDSPNATHNSKPDPLPEETSLQAQQQKKRDVSVDVQDVSNKGAVFLLPVNLLGKDLFSFLCFNFNHVALRHWCFRELKIPD